MRTPRLLPLVGIAIGGVVAVNALSGAHALPQLFSATQAVAEEALSHPGPRRGKAPPKPAPSSVTTPPPSTSPLPSGLNPKSGTTPIGSVCAPSATELAKAAGLSPAELQMLQNLQARRGQIDSREKDVDTEVQLLAAAEVKLDAKLKSMNTLKAEIQGLMGQADQKTQGEVDRLVVVYSKMRPGDAAAIMAQLDDKVRLPIAAAMKPATLSAILSKMGATEAKILTEKLAHRFAPMQAVAEAGNGTASAARGGPGAAAKPPAPVVETAAEQDDQSAPSADPPAKAAAKPARKVRKAQATRKALARSSTALARADTASPPAGPQPYTALKGKAQDPPPPAAPAKSS